MNLKKQTAYVALDRVSINWIRYLVGVMACCSCTLALSDTPNAQLRAQYEVIRPKLENNPFQRALSINSSESADLLTGEVHAVIEQPFSTVSTALQVPSNWCDILILHLNTKSCTVISDDRDTQLKIRIGKKVAQEPEDAHPVNLSYRVMASAPDFLGLRMTANEGPLGTSNYRIVLEAIPLAARRTFLHFTYSYRSGLAGELAMKTYLATLGSNKVGFTITGQRPDGKPDYIGGVRGVVERNTMRYFLAIDSYFNALRFPQDQQVEKRLQNWYAATERYPRQLHEIERAAYLEMKRNEVRRSNKS